VHKKTVLSIGAGIPQLDFIKSLKQRDYYTVAIGMGRNSKEAINLCDDFAEIDTHHVDNVIAWAKGYERKIDAVGSFAGGKAILTLQLLNHALNLDTKIPEECILGVDKVDQQSFYQKYGLSSIKTWNIMEIRKDLSLFTDNQKFILKPLEGRGSSGVRVVDKNSLIPLLDNNDLDDSIIIQEYKNGVEYRVLVLVQEKQIKLLAPIKRTSFEGTFLLGRLVYCEQDLDKIESYFSRLLHLFPFENVIIKADILVGKDYIDMIEMDIGVGGGIYYKKYLSQLYDYDLINEYINLITGSQVKEASRPTDHYVMDYVYNFKGCPFDYRINEVADQISSFLGAHVIIPNLMHPEKSGKFETNADFIFTIIHKNDQISNTELNNFINQKIFNNG